MKNYTVTRDGQTLASFETENQAWGYLLDIQSQSIMWACKHEGYDIVYPNGGALSDTYRHGIGVLGTGAGVVVVMEKKEA